MLIVMHHRVYHAMCDLPMPTPDSSLLHASETNEGYLLYLLHYPQRLGAMLIP